MSRAAFSSLQTQQGYREAQYNGTMIGSAFEGLPSPWTKRRPEASILRLDWKWTFGRLKKRINEVLA